jgi:hypothetical protein
MNTEQHRPVTARIDNRMNNNIQEYGHQTARISNRTDIQQRKYTTARQTKAPIPDSTNIQPNKNATAGTPNSMETQQQKQYKAYTPTDAYFKIFILL